MMDDHIKLEMVDRYLLGQMNQEEADEFEQLMTTDREIKAFVDSQKTLIRGMEKYQEKVAFLDMLESIKKDKSTQNNSPADSTNTKIGTDNISTSKVRKLRFGLAIAAGIAFLVTALLFILDTRVDPSDLASDNFSFHTDLLSDQLEAMGATDDANKVLIPLLQRGIEFYKQGDYETAKAEFQQFKEQSKSRNYIAMLNDFYLAQIAFYHNQPEETIKLLAPLQTERGLPIEAATKWYLALAYLKIQEVNTAKKIFEDLQSNNDYGSQANKILKNL